VPFLRERTQRLCQEHAPLDPDSDLAGLRLEERAIDADDVTEVEFPERRVASSPTTSFFT